MATTIKTAISIDKSLFEQAEILARQLNISRSHLFGMAVENYIQRHQSQVLLDQINAAYADAPDPSEQKRLYKTRQSHRKILDGEW